MKGKRRYFVPGFINAHIIHDWKDGEAIAIVCNCRGAMNSNGRILIVEMVIPPPNEPCFGKWLNLMMLLVSDRNERKRSTDVCFPQQR